MLAKNLIFKIIFKRFFRIKKSIQIKLIIFDKENKSWKKFFMIWNLEKSYSQVIV